jgi:hypothetical protein
MQLLAGGLLHLMQPNTLIFSLTSDADVTLADYSDGYSIDSSSLFVAMAVKTAREFPTRNKLASAYIASGGALGVCFVIVKGFEWSARFAADQTISTNASSCSISCIPVSTWSTS